VSTPGEFGLDPHVFRTHSFRRTKATLIRIGNLRAVQLLGDLGWALAALHKTRKTCFDNVASPSTTPARIPVAEEGEGCGRELLANQPCKQ
jgi:hypothetical protein